MDFVRDIGGLKGNSELQSSRKKSFEALKRRSRLELRKLDMFESKKKKFAFNVDSKTELYTYISVDVFLKNSILY